MRGNNKQYIRAGLFSIGKVNKTYYVSFNVQAYMEKQLVETHLNLNMSIDRFCHVLIMEAIMEYEQ